jgi:hypothetical protein
MRSTLINLSKRVTIPQLSPTHTSARIIKLLQPAATTSSTTTGTDNSWKPLVYYIYSLTCHLYTTSKHRKCTTLYRTSMRILQIKNTVEKSAIVILILPCLCCNILTSKSKLLHLLCRQLRKTASCARTILISLGIFYRLFTIV